MSAPLELPGVLNPQDPMSSALKFLQLTFTVQNNRTLHYRHGDYYRWRGTHYETVHPETISAEVWKFLHRAERWIDKERTGPFQPKKDSAGNVMAALQALTTIDTDAPAWLDKIVESFEPPAAEMLAVANGLLWLRQRRLQPPTPGFFGVNAVPFAYDPSAGDPVLWLKFLNEIWPGDAESIELLQEWFGLCLTSITKFHKILLLQGAKRSGKGTIARVLGAMLGEANVVSPTLKSLTNDFGLQPLIGKAVAVISDGRMSGKMDLQAAVAEHLLSISGEDSPAINRKSRTHWEGKLHCRLILMTNELPKISDSAAALANRFHVLQLRHSVLGKEDPDLTDKLKRELPAILNWSLTGMDRLLARGKFVQPASSADAIQELENLGSPVIAFVRARCTLGTDQIVDLSTLYSRYKVYCEATGRIAIDDEPTFARNLIAAFPHITKSHPRSGGGRITRYHGIG